MRTIVSIIVLAVLFMVFSCCSLNRQTHIEQKAKFSYHTCCGQDFFLQNKTNRAIAKAKNEADTIFIYGVAFNNWRVLWYYKSNNIHSCWISPYKITWNPVVKTEIQNLDSVSVTQCFNDGYQKDILCFEDELDGETIYMIVKETHYSTSINSDCLFTHKFPVNSFPYRLQNDLARIVLGNDTVKQLYP
jgi:hypothetical protein